MILIKRDMRCNVHAIKADADDSVSVLVWGVVATWEPLMCVIARWHRGRTADHTKRWVSWKGLSFKCSSLGCRPQRC